MKKNAVLEAWLDQWEQGEAQNGQATPHHRSYPSEYRAFFFCFNAGMYYEAHDVLEHLWLGCRDSNRSFYQALIQLAGAFVHFQKQALFPTHPTHSRRLAPGRRLLALADARLRQYSGLHMGLDLQAVLQLCDLWSVRAESDPRPLGRFAAPFLELK